MKFSKLAAERRSGSPVFIALIILVLFLPCAEAEASEYNVFVIDGFIYETDIGFFYNYGNYYGENATNIDMFLEGEYIDIYFELFVPNNYDRIIAGTYSLSNEYPPPPFTFLSGSMVTFDVYYEAYYEVLDGTLEVSVSGTGDDAIFTIAINCLVEDDYGDIFRIRGIYRGPLLEDW